MNCSGFEFVSMFPLSSSWGFPSFSQRIESGWGRKASDRGSDLWFSLLDYGTSLVYEIPSVKKGSRVRFSFLVPWSLLFLKDCVGGLLSVKSWCFPGDIVSFFFYLSQFSWKIVSAYLTFDNSLWNNFNFFPQKHLYLFSLII